MRSSALLLALLALTFCAVPARAVDLTKIERTVAKEPAYQTKAPKYCLLVFGPEAQFRVWLVLDGDVLYVDRKGNGDLTGGEQIKASKRVYRNGPNTSTVTEFKSAILTEPDGKTRHTGLHVSFLNDHLQEISIKTHGGLEQVASSNRQSRLQWGDRPQDAPIIHFGGPLTIMATRPLLIRGQDCDLVPKIGTPGLGQGTFAQIGMTAKEIKKENPQKTPMAEIELPGNGPGADPIKLTVKFEPDS